MEGESGPDSTNPEVTLTRPGCSPYHLRAPHPSAPAEKGGMTPRTTGSYLEGLGMFLAFSSP